MKLINKFKGLPFGTKLRFIAVVSLGLVLMISIPVSAWFSEQRKLGDLERVDAPTELYITAPYGDQIKYLRPDDIEVTTNRKSSYYAFTVSGSDALFYSLQLAFTTNNQFEYYIYPAVEVPAETAESNPSSYLAKHTVHDENGKPTTTHYYTIDTSVFGDTVPEGSANSQYRLANGAVIRDSAITAGYLNKLGSDTIQANDVYHDETYHYNSGTQIYAEPLYWQAKRIRSGMDLSDTITDNYILEINWEKAYDQLGINLKNDRETDIIYISVEATT